jgi:predicted P-loop ATPase
MPAAVSRSPHEAFRNPRTPGRRRKPADDADAPKPNGEDHGEPLGYGEPEWIGWAQKSRQGNLLNNFNNAVLALERDPLFTALFAHDDMARQTVTRRVIGGQTNPRPAGLLHDNHISAVQRALQRLGLRHVGREVTVQAIEFVAHQARFHPLRDWLDGLAWDEAPRLDNLLASYFGADDREDRTRAYLQRVGPMFLIGMVARVYEPGCQHDYMLVLEGPQGILKSSALRVLGGQWFSDALPDLNGDPVRLSQFLRGKWLIEVPELASFRGAASEHLKSFVSRPVEDYIPKFGQGEVHEPRQCAFAGTTNQKVYLHDETGGRRYWPVTCGTIDLASLRQHRDQLLAEAVDRYKRGASHYPEPGWEADHLKPRQEARYEADEAWEPAVASYLRGRNTSVYVKDIAIEALDFAASRIGRADQRRITTILDRLGWRRGQRTAISIPWLPPGSADDPPPF